MVALAAKTRGEALLPADLAGAAQVLVLGAGYDMLCWRLAPEFPGVRFFEVDHPATATAKTTAIEAMGRPDNMALIAADLGAARLPDVMAASPGWRSDARSVIVAEGLLYYLPAADVVDLFGQLGDCAAPGSRMAFTYFEPGGPSRVGWVAPALTLIGEPWLWLVERGDLSTFVDGTPWRLAPITDEPDCTKPGERFAVAERNGL